MSKKVSQRLDPKAAELIQFLCMKTEVFSKSNLQAFNALHHLKIIWYDDICPYYLLLPGNVSVSCRSFTSFFCAYSPMLSWHNLYMNEYKKNIVTAENPCLRKVQHCILIQSFLQFYLQYMLNVSSMKAFHQKNPQEILYKMLFLFLDNYYLVLKPYHISSDQT